MPMVFKTKDYLYDTDRLQEAIDLHRSLGSIADETMSESVISMNFERAKNELRLTKSILTISQDEKIKEKLDLLSTDTFYSQTISHAYYCMFFAAKALLLSQGIKTRPPNVHKATLDGFASYFVINGKIDMKLFEIYKSNLIKADTLLGLLAEEQEKRGEFTYKILPQSNIGPARESISHADEFLMHIDNLLKKR